MGELVVLNNEELLRKLALLIYRQEVLDIENIKFKSEPHRAKYLRDCQSSYNSVLDILAAAGAARDKFHDHETKAPIVLEIYNYSLKCVNTALQTVQNYSVRLNYLDKIKNHADTLLRAVDELDPQNVTNVRRLAKEATQYREAMERYLKKYQSGASKAFSQWLKAKGMKFEDMVIRYKNELGFTGAFENLEEEEKIMVYNRIIESSGRGQIITEVADTAFGVAGAAVLVFTLGTMVWEIFSSERPVEMATKDAVMVVAGVGGAAIGDIMGAAAATMAEEAGLSSIFVTALGVITSFAGAFVIGEMVGVLISLIFTSGGTAPLPTEGYHCYVAPLPDGSALARQLAHDLGLTAQTIVP